MASGTNLNRDLHRDFRFAVDHFAPTIHYTQSLPSSHYQHDYGYLLRASSAGNERLSSHTNHGSVSYPPLPKSAQTNSSFRPWDLLPTPTYHEPTSTSATERADPPLPTNPPLPTSGFYTMTIPKEKPSGPCQKHIIVGGKLDTSDVCTWYDNYVHTTAQIDCGGCELKTLGMGHGPMKRCKVTIKLPATTMTHTACAASGALQATAA